MPRVTKETRSFGSTKPSLYSYAEKPVQEAPKYRKPEQPVHIGPCDCIRTSYHIISNVDLKSKTNETPPDGVEVGVAYTAKQASIMLNRHKEARKYKMTMGAFVRIDVRPIYTLALHPEVADASAA